MQQYTFSDFNLVQSTIHEFSESIDINNKSLAFMPYWIMTKFVNLQLDDVIDCITDTAFIKSSNSTTSGHDAGIDAIYIDDEQANRVVHLFSFKYTEKFEKINNHFPSKELSVLKAFITDLMSKSESLVTRVNPILAESIRNIWEVLNSSRKVDFVIHFSSNYAQGLISSELADFKDFLKTYRVFTIQEETIGHIIDEIISKERVAINAKLTLIDKNYFEKASGDVTALIANVDVRELLKIITDDELLRMDSKIEDYEIIKSKNIDENVFADNVRLYLKQKTKINKSIMNTALSNESFRFFYYNNGITITCSDFSYPPNLRAPTVYLDNLQIVNGSQTLHSLFEAFQQNSENFSDMDILCRIYKTQNTELSSAIAEYTNSQNPVTSRDIRSNDYTQKKLELDLKNYGYLYERKNRQYFSTKDKSIVIDAEKTGQAILAFYLSKPAEAKDLKRTIFAEAYDEIFSDDIDAQAVILAFNCFYYVETIKKQLKKQIEMGHIDQSNDFVMSATYYIMYVIKIFIERDNIVLDLHNFNLHKSELYNKAYYVVKESVNREVINLGRKYNHRAFFKGASPKNYINKILDEGIPEHINHII